MFQTRQQNPNILQQPLREHQSLKIEAKTWIRDSHGLYDYESSQLNVQNLKVIGQQVPTAQIEKSNDPQIKQDVLMKGGYKNGKYYIFHQKSLTDDSFDDASQMVWFIIKYLDLRAMKFSSRKVIDEKHLSRYPLSQGEIIKFGRVAYKISKIYKPNKNSNVNSNQKHSTSVQGGLDVTQTEGDNYQTRNYENWDDDNNSKAPPDLRPVNFKEATDGDKLNLKELKRPQTAQMCRICLSEDEIEQGNPLVSPCKCSGSMSMIHVKCINEWLNNKRETRVSATTSSYQWTIIECELCMQKFPDTVVASNGKVYKIFDFEEPTNEDNPYIIFQSVFQSKKVKTFHVVYTSKRKITKVGRAYETDMRVPDISVSRLHSQIVYKNDQFYLEDLESKFGTLLLLHKPFQFDDALKNIRVQVGRTIIKIENIRQTQTKEEEKNCFKKMFSCMKPQAQKNQIMSSFIDQNQQVNEYIAKDKEFFPKEINKLIELEEIEKEQNAHDKIKIELVKEDFGTIQQFSNPYQLTARQALLTSNDFETARYSDTQTNLAQQLSITNQVSADNMIRNNYQRRRLGPDAPLRQREEQKRNYPHMNILDNYRSSIAGGGYEQATQHQVLGPGQSFISQPNMLSSNAHQDDDDPQVEEIINSILYDHNNNINNID